MLSSKLVQLVEDHWDTIAGRVIQEIRNDPHLSHIRKLPDSELRTWGKTILKNLGHWLLESDDAEVARRYESLGRLRYQESVPLHESVKGMHLLKRNLLDFIRDQGFCQTTVDLYAEEELEHQVGRFFDSALYHLVKAYEAELRHNQHQTA
jgi:hypothetical protein